MSLFASQTTKPVDIEGEGTFVIRKLNRKRLAKASRAIAIDAIAHVEALGGPGRLKALREMASDDTKKEAEAIRAAEKQAEEAGTNDGFAQHDKSVLIAEGVVSWPDGATPTMEQIEDLDPAVEERLAREVYDLSRPPLKND